MSEENKNEDVVLTEASESEIVVEEKVEAPAADLVEEVAAEKSETILSVIPEESVQEDPKPALAPVANGVIGSSAADRKEKKSQVKAVAKPADTVAVFSQRNISWVGLGKLVKGINIVSKADAEKWLTRDSIREATPEEVAKRYGK